MRPSAVLQIEERHHAIAHHQRLPALSPDGLLAMLLLSLSWQSVVAIFSVRTP